MRASPSAASSGTVDPAEIRRFAALAEEWWSPDGKFRPLHALNPIRLAFIREQAVRRFGLDPARRSPLEGLDAIDIGCGGGLLAEPVRRMGARLIGLDADAEGLAVARHHASEVGLEIDYRLGSAEELAASGAQFDLVLAMEILEHVADRDAFLDACAALTRPGGLFIAATLNRTVKAFALAVVGAEYLLRWLPAGTHDWRKFVRPSELASGLRRNGLQVEALTGVAYDPISGTWRLSPDLDVNYMLAASKAA
ncbi:MAG: ubiG [Rhodospirillales bacterium]|jgi:2-polyprenyl-6-hydroxyphenyl methylase/3-demethylubiquinone-9 3-methyltransferase|nr:ubiG [Rhodospirillales bacterium]